MMKLSIFLMIVAFAAVNATPFKRCSEQRFRTAITGAGGKTMPPVAVPCQKAVYAALCHECGDDIGCFWSKGPKIAPTLSECQHHKTGRNLRSLVGSSTRCNEKSFQEAIAKVPTTGVALGCQRAVYNALCDTCGSSTKCYMEKGPSIAKSTPLCRPREVTTYDMEDEEEQVGGRAGRVCAIAACLFIDGLNPPREPYRPGASNGNPPIHRPYRGADMMEDGDVNNVGGYMHNGKYYYDGQAANSNYHPGGGFHHNGNSYPSGTYMDEDDESVGFGDERPSHTRAHRPTSKSVGDWINFRL